jgi:membrane-associated phospholipid phosphatase
MLNELVKLDADWTERLRLVPGTPVWWPLASFLAHSGDSWFWLVGLGVIWLFAPGEWHARAFILGVAIVIQALIVFSIKLIIRRKRPEGEWGAIYRNTDPHSFPSGHAARAAMLACMALGLGPPWFAISVLIWALLVILARVLMGVHYLLDVIAGALLGILVGWGLYQLVPYLFVWFQKFINR